MLHFYTNCVQILIMLAVNGNTLQRLFLIMESLLANVTWTIYCSELTFESKKWSERFVSYSSRKINCIVCESLYGNIIRCLFNDEYHSLINQTSQAFSFLYSLDTHKVTRNLYVVCGYTNIKIIKYYQRYYPWCYLIYQCVLFIDPDLTVIDRL